MGLPGRDAGRLLPPAEAALPPRDRAPAAAPPGACWLRCRLAARLNSSSMRTSSASTCSKPGRALRQRASTMGAVGRGGQGGGGWQEARGVERATGRSRQRQQQGSEGRPSTGIGWPASPPRPPPATSERTRGPGASTAPPGGGRARGSRPGTRGAACRLRVHACGACRRGGHVSQGVCAGGPRCCAPAGFLVRRARARTCTRGPPHTPGRPSPRTRHAQADLAVQQAVVRLLAVEHLPDWRGAGSRGGGGRGGRGEGGAGGREDWGRRLPGLRPAPALASRRHRGHAAPRPHSVPPSAAQHTPLTHDAKGVDVRGLGQAVGGKGLGRGVGDGAQRGAQAAGG